MNGKIAAVLFLTLTLFVSHSLQNDLILGRVQNGDRLLYDKTLSDYSGWGAKREIILSYPVTGSSGTIHAIYVYDQRYKGKPAYASIISGGIGYKNVKIRLHSGPYLSYGISFKIKIYGL